MVVENQGVNADPANQQGVTQPATGTGDNAGVATGEGAVSQPATETTVSYDRFKEVNDRMKVAEESARNLQNQFMILQANQQRNPPTPTAQPSILAELGIAEDEPYIPTAQIPRIMRNIDERTARIVSQIVNSVQGEQTLKEMPDYGDVVGTNQFGNFVPSQHLTKVLQKKPYLAGVIARAGASPDTMRLAYNEVVNDPDYKQHKQLATMNPQQRINADVAARVTAANQQVMSSSAAGGGQVGKIDSISGMSDDQMRAHRSQASAKG